MPASLYHTVFLYSVILLTFLSFSTVKTSYREIRLSQGYAFTALIICLVYAIWIGGRPLSGFYFGDTSNYAHTFELMQNGQFNSDSDEIFWYYLMYYSAQIMDPTMFLTLVDIGYFGFTLWASKRFAPNNVLVCLLFFMGALSFFSYGTNGIRNGLACSIVLVCLSYLSGNKKEKLISLIFAVVAYNIHHSTALPLTMAYISCFFIRSFKWSLGFWVLSIFISLVAGNSIATAFAGLGFDDRLSYLTTDADAQEFSHTGFRWDFLLYSAMPLVLGYYAVFKRGVRNRTYLFLLNTYTLTNAFWVMVIRANFTNRFAYLSWFMYPLVLAYPLLETDIWGWEQGKKLKLIMTAQIAFTWVMQTIYWS